MASLQSEHKKREKELELLRSSEPKLQRELNGLREAMSSMKSDIVAFEDIEGLRRKFEATQQMLKEKKISYMKRRDSMRQQV
jgi:predicted  nucleic acid-binding Zn-ribbon protein